MNHGCCLCIAQRKRNHFAGVGPVIGKSDPFKGNGGVSYGRGDKRDASAVILRIRGSILGIEHSQGDGARRMTAFPGDLCEAQIRSQLYPAAKRDVLAQHRIHPLRDRHAASTHTCLGKNKRETQINNSKTLLS